MLFFLLCLLKLGFFGMGTGDDISAFWLFPGVWKHARLESEPQQTPLRLNNKTGSEEALEGGNVTTILFLVDNLAVLRDTTQARSAAPNSFCRKHKKTTHNNPDGYGWRERRGLAMPPAQKETTCMAACHISPRRVGRSLVCND